MVQDGDCRFDMKTVTNPHITFIDIDDTLVYWEKNGQRPCVIIKTPWVEETLEVNENMLNNIKQLSLRGFYIVLWSQSGHEWCEAVAKALDIEDKISLCMTKPGFFYDDLPIEAWGRRIAP